MPVSIPSSIAVSIELKNPILHLGQVVDVLGQQVGTVDVGDACQDERSVSHIGAEECEATRLRSRQLVLGVSCGCDCFRAAYQVASTARNAKTLTWKFLSVRHRPTTPDFRSQLPHGVLAVLSEDPRVQRVQDVDRNGSWQSHAQGFWKNEARELGNRLFGLPPEGDTHRQPRDEVVETDDVGQLAAGLQSVVGLEVQPRDVFQKAPPVVTACPVVELEQRRDASVGR